MSQSTASLARGSVRAAASALGLPFLLALLSCSPSEAAEPERVVLPVARNERPVEADSGVVTLDLRADGRIEVGGETIHDPETGKYDALDEWLANTALAMHKEYLDEQETGPMFPADTLLVRADQNAPFVFVQRLMERCGRREVMIWKIEFAVRSAEKEGRLRKPAGKLDAHLPAGLDEVAVDAEPVERLEVIARVLDPGTRLAADGGGPWTGGDERYVWSDDRVLQYQLGPFRTKKPEALGERIAEVRHKYPDMDVVVDPRPGTTHAEVVAILDLVLDAGPKKVRFVGAR